MPEPQRAEALDDAVTLAVADQRSAGLTVVTDGEQRRQTFSGHFCSFGGIDQDHQGAVTNFSNDVGGYLTMKARARAAGDEPPAPPTFEQPRIVGPITWDGPLLGNDARFLRRIAGGPTKITIIGPNTLALRLVDEHYGSLRDVALALADVLNQECRAMADLGIDIVQIDEPEVHFRYSQVADVAAEAIDRCLAGVDATTAVHVCYAYARNIAEKRATPVYEQALQLLGSTTVDQISLESGPRPRLRDVVPAPRPRPGQDHQHGAGGPGAATVLMDRRRPCLSRPVAAPRPGTAPLAPVRYRMPGRRPRAGAARGVP